VDEICQIKDNIKRKYNLYDKKINQDSLVYFIFINELEGYLKKEIKRGKIIKEENESLLIKSDDKYKVPKCLVFDTFQKTAFTCDKMNIDELRMIV
jgi:hypothetical protein